MMFGVWLSSARAHAMASADSRDARRTRGPAAERHFPVSVVVTHGFFAVVTLLLVMYTAVLGHH
ncbi:MAG TPA: hypothetical protein VGM10_20175 [Actinocrinis sp.]|jgi:hypothetical protein